MKPKRIRPPRNAAPAVHRRKLSSIIDSDGARASFPSCGGNGWMLTDDPAAVTCKRCIKRGAP